LGGTTFPAPPTGCRTFRAGAYTSAARWPEERTTWTGGAMILAADALSRTTPANGIFRGLDLPRGLVGEFDCECATTNR